MVHRLPGAIVVVVADGAGGISGGGAAADTFVRGVVEASDSGLANLGNLLRGLDIEIAGMPHGGETTGVIVVVTGEGVRGASCGDSGAWILHDGEYDDLTVEQTRKRLGSGQVEPVLFSRGPLTAGTLVVATDGLFNYTAARVICAAASESSLQGALDRLVEHARTASGSLADDVAVALVRLSA